MTFNIDSVVSSIPLDTDPHDFDLLDEHIDYSDIERKYAFTSADKFSCIVVIDGLPIVTQSRQAKLVSVLSSHFEKAGFSFEPSAFYAPFNSVNDAGDAVSDGYMFLFCDKISIAESIVKTFQKFAFDKAHTLLFNKFVDIERYSNVPAVWDEATALGPAPPIKQRPFLQNWLLDPEARDQFAYYHRDSITIQWHDPADKPVPVRVFSKMPQTFITWSPRGAYFSTAHEEGIALYTGDDFSTCTRFNHPSVALFDFSPCENYLITYSDDPLPAPSPSKPWTVESKGHRIIIWDIVSGKIMRTFPQGIFPPPSASLSGNNSQYDSSVAWPFFKWSSDDRFFAAICDKTSRLAVFEAPSMMQVDKNFYQSITNVSDFEWMPVGSCSPETPSTTVISGDAATAKGNKSKGAKKSASSSALPAFNPLAHALAYFCPAVGNDRPAQIVVLNASSRQTLTRRQMFNASAASIKFSKSGQYLMLRIARSLRNGKSPFTSIEICRLQEKDYPWDAIDLRVPVCDAEMAPSGNHLAVICWDSVSGTTNADNTADLKVIKNGASGRMVIGFYEIVTKFSGAATAIPGMPKNSSTSSNSGLLIPGLHPGAGLAAAAAAQAAAQSAALPSSNTIRLLRQFGERSVNTISWRPCGRFLVAAGLNNLGGRLEFYDVDASKGSKSAASTKMSHKLHGETYTTMRVLEPVVMTQTQEHIGCQEIYWDPSSRFVATVVNSDTKSCDPGYVMWTFNGKIHHKEEVAKLKQFLWRPLPPSLLVAKRIESINSNINNYIRENEDQHRKMQEAKAAKEAKMKEDIFREFLFKRSANLRNVFDVINNPAATLQSSH